MKALVHIARCPDYDQERVDEAVREACESANFPDAVGKTVLFKPNILIGANPDRAVSTHPSVLRAAIRYAKAKGAARVLVGDSPSFQAGGSAFRKSGLQDAAQEEGAEWADFEVGERLDAPEGRVAMGFTVASAALQADVLVSLCKLKNHTLMYYTGALKNLFGCIPGLLKAQFHVRFPDRKRFGVMLNDLAQALAPEFSLMDAVIGMEGPGPGS
ncbi:MAG: DUF362 domain-containing protein, partial [Spirochaetaceae bacterium]|nr:DUF362 domain-containing protein [Spirochaetaceae bacterium]